MATRRVSRGVLSLVIAAGLAAGLSTGLAARQDAAPKISARDQLKITVLGADGISTGPYTVDADGTIDYPYLKRITAEGLTTRELGARISQRLVEEGVLVGSPQVSVELTQAAIRNIVVSGEVMNRGEYSFTGETRVFNALVKAGGATPDAGDEVLVIRAPKTSAPASATAAPEAAGAAGDTTRGDEVLTLSRRAIENGDPAADTQLHDGDRVIVQKAKQVYIDGQVSRPGGYTVSAGTTLRQALALAGGATELGALNRIRILRNGKRVDDIDLDKTIIQPGDTITVPKKFM